MAITSTTDSIEDVRSEFVANSVDKAGQVRIKDIAGADVIVEVNTGGSLAADFSIRLRATALREMSASDFVLRARHARKFR